ncbi:MAG: DUF501 domain-containing protein [bacterium]
MAKITKKDKMIIKKQLDKEPENLRAVALRCPQGNPVVLKTSPFSEKNGVFPTIYWLSCPFYGQHVSRLEDQGLVKNLTKKLQQDPEFALRLKEAHNRYARERFNLLNQEQIAKIKKISLDILVVLKNSGVGGIRDKKGIKCLHTHLADFLVNGQNPVGKKVIKKMPDLEDCPFQDCDIC